MRQTAKKVPSNQPSLSRIAVEEDKITAHINDGRIVSIPITWFPRLLQASLEELQNFEISPSGYGVHWPDVDEDVSIKAFIS